MRYNVRYDELIELECVDGSRHDGVPASIKRNMVIVPEDTIKIGVNDVVIRKLDNGTVQRFVVTDCGFFIRYEGTSSFHQIKYQQVEERPTGQTVYAAGSISNSYGSVKVFEKSSESIKPDIKDLAQISEELESIRQSLLKIASSPEHYVILGLVSQAKIAIKSVK